ncbi:MAG: serine/threonine-protein kinase [Phycisphaerae bacterium]
MAYTFKHGDRPLEGLTIQRAVGRGGFGEVYYALADSGKQIAVKYLRENPEVELRGIAHVMNLKSPYLVSIFDVKKNAENEPFVLMEYVTGPSLRELMNVDPSGMGVQKAAFFVTGIAKGLAYLHDRGIVHRDLKPGNIFYDDGYVKIGDYGLSKHIAISAHSGNTVSVGTVHYMAPEIGSGSYSKAIDIYALGVILYEMLTGKLPFAGSSMGEILMRHLTENADTTGIPEPFASVIARALAKNPNDRFQSVDAMIDAIMSAGNISTEMASFDPASLTHVRREEEPGDHDRTRTTPYERPRVPVLDAREIADAPLPEIPPLPGERAENKYVYHADIGQKIRDGLEIAREQGLTVGRERWPTLLTMAVITVAVAGGCFVISGNKSEEMPIAIGLMMAGATVGALLNHFVLAKRMVGGEGLPGRIMCAAFGFVCMIPGLIVADEAGGRVQALIFPLLAVLGFFDIRQRIEGGQRGNINAGDAFMPGFVGLIAAAIGKAHELVFVGAAMAATLSILTQMGGSLFPIAPTRSARSRNAGRADRDKDDTSVWLNRTERPAAAAPAAQRSPVNLPPIPAIPASTPMPAIPAATVAAEPDSRLSASGMLGAIPGWQRNLWKLAAALAMIMMIIGFVAVGTTRGDDRVVGFVMAMSSMSLHGFFKFKGSQVLPLSAWQGTLRPLLSALCFAAACIPMGLIAFGDRDHNKPMLAASMIGFLCAAGAFRNKDRKTTEPSVAKTIAASNQPGFFARLANMSFSFVGQILVLVGLVAALAFIGPRMDEASDMNAIARVGAPAAPIPPIAPVIDFRAGGERVYADRGRIMLTEDGRTRQIAEIKPAVILIPLAIGSFFLVLARRHDGSTHMFRAMLGCGAVMGAAILAVGPASTELATVINSNDWSTLSDDMVKPVLAVSGLMVGALCLMLWPKPRAKTPGVIVI